MASTGKKKTTMAKLNRESRLRERRLEKQARKRSRKEGAALLLSQPDGPLTSGEEPSSAELPEMVSSEVEPSRG
jgi:hypothetical protein